MGRQGLHKPSCKVLLELLLWSCPVMPTACAWAACLHSSGGSGDRGSPCQWSFWGLLSPRDMDTSVSSLLLGPSTTYSPESWEVPGRTSQTISIAAGSEKAWQDRDKILTLQNAAERARFPGPWSRRELLLFAALLHLHCQLCDLVSFTIKILLRSLRSCILSSPTT